MDSSGADQSEVRIQLKRQFLDFLDRDHQGGYNYRTALEGLYTQLEDDGTGEKPKGKGLVMLSRRIIVREHHLRDFNPSLVISLVNTPAEALPALEDAVKEFARANADENLARLLADDGELHVGIQGDQGKHEVSPRELTSTFLNKLVSLFGIVTKVSLVRPKIVKSTHYCEVTKQFTMREYRDVTSLTGMPTGAAYPQRDDAGNPLTTEFGLCKYKDNQMVTMQELPETAPPGQLPHSAEVVLEDDLVDSIKPGDRVSITGVYKAIPNRGSGPTSGVMKAIVVGVAVHKLDREAQLKMSLREGQEITRLANQEGGCLDLLAASLAPSIYGHDLIKKGLILMLLGGIEKNLENGTHLRGDVNCLMVGDPGVAKSQLLRAVMNVAPHAVSTTGRGSSGVGLTAAITSDSETGERRLEAGAMVLADRGVVCIDEFDKMSDQDRVAIHEVMEQQTVTIAKAGIHTSLNARCSVLAAANPLYGSYDKSLSVTRNVNLPDSLLSRFDMLFVVLDQMTDARDRQLALHVITQHRYRPQGEDGRGIEERQTVADRRLSADSDTMDSDEVAFTVKTDARYASSGAAKEVLTSDFLRKFVMFVRRRYRQSGVHMDISDKALERMSAYYQNLRSESRNRALPVTARTLESMIRLASAAAKVRLGMTVEARDVAVAEGILDHCLRKDVGADDDDEEDAAGGAAPGGGAAGGDSDADSDDDGAPPPDQAERAPSARKRTRSRRQTGRRSGRRSDAEAEDAEMADAPGAPGAGADAMDVDADAPGPSSRPAKRTVPSAPAAPAAAPAAGGGSSKGLVCGLSSAQRSRVSDAIAAMCEEPGGDCAFHAVADLQVRVNAAGPSVALGVLWAYLKYCKEHCMEPSHQREYLPQIMVGSDEEKTFWLIG